MGKRGSQGGKGSKREEGGGGGGGGGGHTIMLCNMLFSVSKMFVLSLCKSIHCGEVSI